MSYQSDYKIKKQFYTIISPFRVASLLMKFNGVIQSRLSLFFNSPSVCSANLLPLGELQSTRGELKNISLAKRFSFVLLILLVVSQSFSQTHPTDITGLQLWLRADSNVVLNGSTVSAWKDCSGKVNDVNQITTISQPTIITNALNGQPIIRFDGIDDYLNFKNTISFTGDFSYFMVFKLKNASSIGYGIANTGVRNSPFINWNDNNSYTHVAGSYFGYSTGSQTNYCIVTSQRTSGLINIYINGIKKGSGNLTGTADYNVIGGNTVWGYSTEDIAEIILFNTSLANNDRLNIENYLNSKYSKAVNLGSDINKSNDFCDTTLDAGSGFQSYLWSTGEKTQTIKVNKTGSYSVEVVNTFGNISKDTIVVTYPEIKLNDTSICVGSSIKLNPALSGIYSYKWSTTEITPNITVTNPTTVSITVTDTKLCSSSKTVTISIDSFAVKASLGSDKQICVGNTIGLKSPISLPSTISYHWSNDSTSAEITIIKTGLYSLTATSKNGCIAKDTIQITISGIAPTPNFTYQSEAITNQSVQFTNTSNPKGTSWFWDFGDGTSSVLENPVHSYKKDGLYPIKLTVSSGLCSNILYKYITIVAFNKNGLQLWLRADSNVVLNGSTVSNWKDCSGNGNDLIQSTVNSQPTVIANTLNSQPIIRFDGIDDYLNFKNALSFTGDFSYFMVFKVKNTSSIGYGIANTGVRNSPFINWNDNNSYTHVAGSYFQCKTGSLTNYCIVTTQRLSGLINIYINGIKKGSGNLTGTADYNVIGGNTVWGYSTEDIAEIILFNTSLANNDRLNIENYLNSKYSKAVNIGSDINRANDFCDTTLDAGSGFQSYLWSTGEKTQTIKANKTDRYFVEVVNTFGNVSKDTIAVTFPEIKISDTSICVGSSIELKPALSGLYSYQWSTNETTTNITVKNPKTVSLTVTDSKLCSSSKTVTISIDSFAVKASLGLDKQICEGNTIGLLSPNPLPSNISYQWSNDSTLAEIAIKKTGLYFVTATSKNGCVAKDTINITISGIAPTPNFTSQSEAITNQSVQFTNTSNPKGTSWLWDFGDGTSSILENPVHSYAHEGNFNVKYTAFINTCSNTISKSISISPFNKNGLKLWLRADSNVILNGSTVSSWKDCSGNGNDVSQNLLISQPYYNKKGFNELPFIQFDGIDDYLSRINPSNSFADNHTIFFVIRVNNISNPYNPIAGYLDSNSLTNGGGPFYVRFDGKGASYPHWRTTNNYYYDGTGNQTYYTKYAFVLTFQFQKNNNSSVYKNGLLDATFISKAVTNSIYMEFGAQRATNGFSNLDFSEIIVFNSALQNTDRIKVETYLKNKYIPKPVNLGADIVITNKLCDTVLHAGKRFSNFLWNTGDTTESIKITKSGIYSVDAVDSVFGFSSTSKIKVTFNVEPKLVRDTAICPGSTLVWDTKLDTANFAFAWSTKDTTSKISIAKAGNYVLTVFDKYGCHYISDTAHIVIDDFNKSIDLGNDTTLCKYNEIALQKGQNRSVLYKWSNDSTNQALTVLSAGTYYLTATDKYSCTAVDSIHIKALSGVAPDTKFLVTGHCDNDSISFTDISSSRNTSKIIAWKWFVQNDTITKQNMKYLFRNPGNYYAKLLLRTDGACTGSKTMPLTIHPKPIASFKPNTLCQFISNTFINTSSILNTDSIINIKWKFSDSSIINKDTIHRSFQNAAKITVSLMATSSKYCVDTISKIIEVKPSPKAIITNSPTCNKSNYFIFDKSIVPNSNSLIERAWYINGFYQGNSATFLYRPDTNKKIDNIQLMVKGVNGCFDTTSINVYPSPNPNAAVQFENNCIGDTAFFYDKSTIKSGQITKWKWNIGDSIESFEQNPKVVFKQPKSYNVSLRISSDVGCEDTTASVINTIKKPIASFDYEPKVVGAPVDINFSNSSENATSYSWNFGDSFLSTNKNPIHEYTDSGLYVVILSAYNDYLCADITKKTITLPKSNYQIILTSIETKDKNGYVSISTIFINSGLNPITTIDFIVKKDDGTWIKETWKGLITTGVVDTFTFASNFRELNATLPKYICIDANVINKHDTIVAKANKCITNIQDLTSFAVYPNPADDKITIHFATKDKGDLEYSIFDNTGKLLKTANKTIPEGFNTLTIPTSDLAQGYYIWKLSINGNNKTGSFLINRN